jgi:hypothetical protein
MAWVPADWDTTGTYYTNPYTGVSGMIYNGQFLVDNGGGNYTQVPMPAELQAGYTAPTSGLDFTVTDRFYSGYETIPNPYGGGEGGGDYMQVPIEGGTNQMTADQFLDWYRNIFGKEYSGPMTQEGMQQQMDGYYTVIQQDRASEAGSFEGFLDNNLVSLLGGALLAGTGWSLSDTLGSLGESFTGTGIESGSAALDPALSSGIESAAGIPELGLVADATTGTAATSAGIPASMLSGGANALTLGGAGMDLSDFLDSTMEEGWADSIFGGSSEEGWSNLLGGSGVSLSPTSLLSSLFGGGSSGTNLLLPLLGGLLGSQSGAQQSGTTTTIQDIPDWQKPYVMGLMDSASKAFGSLDLSNLSKTNESANQELLKTMQGGYLPAFQYNPFGGMNTNVPSNPYYGMNNPYLEQSLNKTLNDVSGRVNSSAYGSGAFGGSANQELLTKNLSDASNQVRYQDFYNQAMLGEADVNRRLQTSLADVNRNAGLWNTDMTRNLANYQTERGRQFASAAGYPDFMSGSTQAAFAPFSQYANIVSKPFGSQTSTPYYSNPWGGALSGALGGLALSKAFT